MLFNQCREINPRKANRAHTYQYPRAALTVDCVVFGFDEGELSAVG